MRCINLGCGYDVRAGYDNYDLCPVDNRVKYIDLNYLPLPFSDNSVDEVVVSHILEHLDVSPYSFMKDVHRILKPNGTVYVMLPVFYNSVVHNSFYHGIGFFDDFVAVNKKEGASIGYSGDIFILVSFKKKSLGLKHGFKKLISFVLDFFYDEYSWELMKK